MKRIRWIALAMVLLLVAGLAACGEKDPNLGKYVMTDEKYSDGSAGKVDQTAYYQLDAGGKGKAERNDLKLGIEWSVEGETLKLKEVLGGLLSLDYEGTLKDGVMIIRDGDLRATVYTREGQTPAKLPEDFFKK